MQYFEHEISGIDGTAAKFVGYCLDNSEEKSSRITAPVRAGDSRRRIRDDVRP